MPSSNVSDPTVCSHEQIVLLITAVRGEEWLIQQCQRILQLYLRGLNSEHALQALLRLLDGPEQRRIQDLAKAALETTATRTTLREEQPWAEA